MPFCLTKAFAQTPEADKILGVWLSEDKTGKIDIYKSDRKYFGKLIWGKTIYEPNGTTSRKDVDNKTEKLRFRNLKDLNIFGFLFRRIIQLHSFLKNHYLKLDCTHTARSSSYQLGSTCMV